jgi:hypothetical protein
VGEKGDPGDNGLAGATGPTGATGAKGDPGRDAAVTCKLKTTNKTKNVVCTVVFAGQTAKTSAAKATAKTLKATSARLTRNGRTYATGSVGHLKSVRKLVHGSHSLRVATSKKDHRRLPHHPALDASRRRGGNIDPADAPSVRRVVRVSGPVASRPAQEVRERPRRGNGDRSAVDAPVASPKRHTVLVARCPNWSRLALERA